MQSCVMNGDGNLFSVRWMEFTNHRTGIFVDGKEKFR